MKGVAHTMAKYKSPFYLLFYVGLGSIAFTFYGVSGYRNRKKSRKNFELLA